MKLLNLKDVAELLGTTPGAARGVLERLGVVPYDLGRGRGLGLRWHPQEIIEALERSRRPRQAPGSKPARKAADPFFGKTTAELIRELAGPSDEEKRKR